MSLYADDMILYIENPKNYTKATRTDKLQMVTAAMKRKDACSLEKKL